MSSKQPSIVYTTGTFDLFHIGHLNVLTAAKGLGDKLVVGVSTDELVAEYKPAKPVVPFEERIRIVGALKCVDIVIPQYTLDKFEAWEKIGFDTWVVGDDWYGNPRYESIAKRLRDVGVKVVYLPYTKGISSTLLKEKIFATS